MSSTPDNSEADRRRRESIYGRLGMLPERLLRDLANAPIVPEEELQDTGEPWRHEGELTTAERDVIMHLSHGLTRKMVAVTLGKSEQTVMSQIKSGRDAVGAKNVTHLVAIALRRGLID